MADNDNGINASTVLLSFLAGAAVGAGMALLVAPKTGKELREKIADLTDDAVTKIKDYASEAQSKISATIDDGKELIKVGYVIGALPDSADGGLADPAEWTVFRAPLSLAHGSA